MYQRRNPNALQASIAGGKLGSVVQRFGSDSPEAEAARVALQTARAEDAIRKLTPTLPEANRRQLADLLLNPTGVSA